MLVAGFLIIINNLFYVVLFNRIKKIYFIFSYSAVQHPVLDITDRQPTEWSFTHIHLSIHKSKAILIAIFQTNSVTSKKCPVKLKNIGLHYVRHRVRLFYVRHMCRKLYRYTSHMGLNWVPFNRDYSHWLVWYNKFIRTNTCSYGRNTYIDKKSNNMRSWQTNFICSVELHLS